MVVVVSAGLAVSARAAALPPRERRANADAPTLSVTTYAAPSGFAGANNAGETSIGSGFADDAALVLLKRTTARVRWDDSVRPPAASWEDVSGLVTSQFTVDPILWTDRVTGRTIVAQNALAGTSLSAASDNEGSTWKTIQPPISAPSYDHQTVGGGPYGSGPRAGFGNYPHAFYYCAQTSADASECARSDDGGLMWTPPLPMNVLTCGGTNGHLAVSPTGEVVVPHKACSASGQTWTQGVLTSSDHALSWTARLVPGLQPSLSDPSVAFDAAGRLYFSTSSGGHAVVVTSDDGGSHWGPPRDVGAASGVVNTEFPMAVAGDAGRAAIAFYGSTTPGNDQDPTYTGVWHLYVAETTDGGRTWSTVDATPDRPIQRGAICLLGILCHGNRNLNDFQTMTADGHGRVLISYADGCITATCRSVSGTPADSTASYAEIARQSGGPRMIAADDPPGTVSIGRFLPPPPPPSRPCSPGGTGPSGEPCLPTPAQCATGAANGFTPGGPPTRAAVCAEVGGHVVVYAGGNAATSCGDVVILDHPVVTTRTDPNDCP